MMQVVFVLVAVATAAAAVATVTSKNLVHAALFLAATLTGIAGVFLVLQAGFLAMVQLVVYVGAIAVLFLFGLMLTRAPIGRDALDSQHRGLGMAVAGTLFAVLVLLILQSRGDFAVSGPVNDAGVAELGRAVFASWVLPFEIVSMLLLSALIGAVLLSRSVTGSSGDETAVSRIEVGDPDDDPSPSRARETR